MYRRGKAYPRELRERVIAAVRSGSSRRAAARRFDIGISTAINWCALERETGDIEPKQRSGNRKRVLEPYGGWIKAQLEATPHMTVLKLQQALASQGVSVSHDTVWRTMRGLGLSFKKKPVCG